MDSDTCNDIVQALDAVISVIQTGAVLRVDKLDTHEKNANIREMRKGCLERVSGTPTKFRPAFFNSSKSGTNAAIIQAQFRATPIVRFRICRLHDAASNSITITRMPLPQIQLVTASGDKLPVIDYLKLQYKWKIRNLHTTS